MVLRSEYKCKYCGGLQIFFIKYDDAFEKLIDFKAESKCVCTEIDEDRFFEYLADYIKLKWTVVNKFSILGSSACKPKPKSGRPRRLGLRTDRKPCSARMCAARLLYALKNAVI